MYTFVDEKSTDSADSNIVSKSDPPSDKILNPKQASTEFGILLANIIKELAKNEDENLELLKVVCSYLTVGKDPDSLMFNEEQQEAINACSNIRTLFTTKLRCCWRWDDFACLKKIVQSVDSSGHCEKLLEQYEEKLSIEMKLQDVYENCQRHKEELPEGYQKMVAIVQNKIFSRITLGEYNTLKDFVSQHCKVESFVMSPFIKASVSSLLLEWLFPLAAAPHMIEMATMNANVFIAQNFIYLNISSTVIFDKRDNVS